ncbi:MAG: hypothetical protein DI626_10945 [Micavibrio aeruginosavorus]|uniref:Uncharacterized protein n=1 Tax=Micavibrio aeruginosavorus TaxID=349221 RepID=A0A2W5BDZ9_9BACT|nr:MAG: hypothetical protein DI626_10945 [Micavibrio aeruginosavorus]
MALMDELERHFALPGQAQAIFEEIKRAEALQKGTVPMIETKAETIDPITFKAISEVIETINPDAFTQPDAPKKGNKEVANDIADWKGRENAKKFSKSYYRIRDAYWFHFYVTMEIYKKDRFVPYKLEVPVPSVVKKLRLNEVWQNTIVLMAA